MPVFIRRGHSGPHVTEIQIRLNTIKVSNSAIVPGLGGYTLLGTLVVDGKFGKNTRSRVMEFQRNNGLKEDGIVGPKTWSVLFGSPMSTTVEAQTSQAEAAKAVAPRQRGHLYIHSYDAPNKNKNGSQHVPSHCHHIEIPRLCGRIDSGEGFRIPDLISK